ncbi:MAG: hypothetical protein ACPG8W_04425 [Candidatus Promineifilaceae bacterium]
MSINNSPFYRTNQSAMPTGNQVEAGGLYMMDDAGGIIFQVMTSTNTDVKPVGSIDVHVGMVATVQRCSKNNGRIMESISYKKGSLNKVHASTICDSWQIQYLIKTSLKPMKEGPRFRVQVSGSDSAFYLYNVYDANGQLVIAHTQTPNSINRGSDKDTDTFVHGMVYVEYKGDVWMGSLSRTEIVVNDPNGEFRE